MRHCYVNLFLRIRKKRPDQLQQRSCVPPPNTFNTDKHKTMVCTFDDIVITACICAHLVLTLVLGVALFAVPSWRWFEICLFLFADMSFAAFVQSLIAASERYSRLEPVGNYLITMIDRYQDCVKACEHQHSKRAEERTADSYIRKQICMYHCYRIVPFFDILNALHQINLIFSKFTKFIIKNISNLKKTFETKL